MVRIYTRTGDRGETSLGDGSRVPKSQNRVDLYGDVDEFNSLLGVVVASLEADAKLATVLGLDLAAILREIQSRLFDLGSVLANPTLCDGIASGQLDGPVPAFPQASLEEHIDTMDSGLQPLRQFILPGGHLCAGQMHVARTVCRRVERRCVELARNESVPADAIAWLNRLSDFLFIAARAVNAQAGVQDITWAPAPLPEEAGSQEG
jgi:cob(I)alamin adenosyltransferase